MQSFKKHIATKIITNRIVSQYDSIHYKNYLIANYFDVFQAFLILKTTKGSILICNYPANRAS